MKYFLVGLGNPGREYENTRHNTGRIVLSHVMKKFDFDDLGENKKLKALSAKGEIGGKDVLAIEPETYMNKSGSSVKEAVKNPKDAARMIVVYDDMDLPLGSFRIAWNRSSGGHNGLESIIKSLRTREFARIRVGVSPATPKGKAKKPSGEEKVIKFLMGKFKPDEMDEIKKASKKIAEAIEVMIAESREKAMTLFN
ncbi:MAG TPA: aminoacyl-tRNA hydrolase [Candidatus Paceibacterota bacterium]|nr:aminoacyl-tRNA hydrolase [Candidatus Paceibacterota bacterium]